MTNEANNPSAVRGDGGHWGGLFRVAIVGAATLKGRELKEVLTDRNFPSQDVRLLDDDESLGQLEAVGDEPTFHSERASRASGECRFHLLRGG